MEQHRVPQNISTYEFRLVGDMTLKQFAELAAGLLTAFLFYSLPLPVYLKFPLVLFFAFLGTALAFLPVGERPLDRWIISFFKAIYSPSQFYWRKKPVIPYFFQKTLLAPAPKEEIFFPEGKRKLRDYLATLPTKEEAGIDKRERLALEKINQLFQKLGLAVNVQPGARIRELTDSLSEGVVFQKTAGVKKAAQGQKPISSEPKVIFKPLVSTRSLNFQERAAKQAWSGKKAKFSQKAPQPLKTETANVLTGIVLDAEGKFLPEAIVSVIDARDLPVRALKTNALGQFYSATPLKNGRYRMEIEKEGYKFDIISLEVKGEIIPPLEIRAKEKAKPKNEEVKILEF